MRKIRFFLGEAFRSLWRNYFMTIAAVVTVFLSMVGLGVVIPLLGHATWHGYRETIDASAWPEH